MNVFNKTLIIIVTVTLFSNCNNRPQPKIIIDETLPPPTIEYAEGTTDEAIANRIKHYLINDYLKNDLKAIPTSDRKFQFQTVDLNNDGQQEIFINFISPYFCGSGGCTLLLLNHDWQIITHFTVTNTPIMIEPHKNKNWAVLMVKDNGVWKELKYTKGKYPSNPSLLPKSKYEAPSGHAQAIFSDKFPAKTFNF